MRLSAPLKRYLMFQVPGWLLTIAILMIVHDTWGLEIWIGVGLFLLLLAKDAVMYPFLRSSHVQDRRTGAEDLVGSTGVAKQRIGPDGYVQIRGELWRARIPESEAPIEAGTSVRVESGDGLLLIVRPEK